MMMAGVKYGMVGKGDDTEMDIDYFNSHVYLVEYAGVTTFVKGAVMLYGTVMSSAKKEC